LFGAAKTIILTTVSGAASIPSLAFLRLQTFLKFITFLRSQAKQVVTNLEGDFNQSINNLLLPLISFQNVKI
jgi:hypothetical protein